MSDQQWFRQRAGSAQQPARAKNRDSRGKKVLHGKLWRAPVERGLRRQKIVPQASACCAKSPNFSDFPGVDPAQQQVRLNVTGVLCNQ